MRQIIGCFIVLMVSTGYLKGQGIQASARLDSTTLTIGDHLGMQIQIEAEAGSHIILPDFLGRDTLGGIEILEIDKVDTLSISPQLKLAQRISLIAFDSGYYRIPPLEIAVQPSGSDAPQMVQTNPIPFRYDLPIDLPAQNDSTQSIKDIKEIQEIGYNWSDVRYYVFIGLGLLAVAAFLIYWFRFRKKPEDQFRYAPPPVPAHELAMRKLSELEAEKRWQTGDMKGYYLGLSYIIREYIEKKFKVPALESITDEILREMASKIDDSSERKLKELLDRCELAKFAKFKPLEAENIQSMEIAREFVKKTKIRGPQKNVVPQTEQV